MLVKSVYRIYCDFDATVTVNDIWDVLFRNLAKPEAFRVWEKFNTGEYTAAQCIQEACDTVQGADEEILRPLFEAEPLRSGFLEFYEYCKAEGLPLTIVSDGFSCYIRPILAKNNIDTEFFANTIEVNEAGGLSVDFTHGRESCRHCGACKCAAIDLTSDENDTIVYIGDGYSDVCPVKIADIVFARDMLCRMCERDSVPYHPFHDFHQVRAILEKYRKERPKYKRDTARKVRRDLYKVE
jgi:2-hydroxy-3-keto-5-methylthiopentenyl-1-phosphate phosphatase